MSGVLEGFTVIFIVIALGYLLARLGVLGPHGQFVLSRLVFYVATPSLLFVTLATSDLSVILSPILVVAGVTALAVGAIYFVVAKFVLKRDVPEATIGGLASSYVNAANLGIPIAVFVLGDANFVAPLLLFQIMVYSPLALTILDLSTMGKKASIRNIVVTPFKNPIVLAGAAGLLLSVFGIELPEALMQPFDLVGGAAVPGALLAFGLSLYGTRVLEKGSSPRRDVVIASSLKMILQPLLGFLMALAMGLEGHELFAITVISALPTAQNVFVFAHRYNRGVVLARDTAFVTTLVSIPVIALVTALLA
ncbi:AEC family transporter [Rhodococcus sp. BP-252]|uniref:AEC family transporter n=1 Tax=Rhodococcoides kyotonense TaxID=398843 RepID=A0A177YI66_9NOCA|nr:MULTISPECIES: AEC family transporter [Rhodococcus]MBY6413169.1 AEC family transporter [Rhodococcus sp. BP-320]MBY6417668.1 AEC family transporter [Rhodococcus sp. BP-321]MBY6423308.1 AEC family transporter [Rhodococcus sp. BP-324]MBY6427911.1 AEC family transporter [Rhodococcus sp. BP-323]MBY6431910.1 AEC family transporter [Rhodococcus sp. BP-322]